MILENSLIQATFWVTSAFSFYTLFRLYMLVFKEVKHKGIAWATFLAGYFICSLQFTLFHSMLHTLAFNITVYIALTYNFRAKFLKHIFIGLGAYALFSLMETLVFVLFTAAGMDIRNNEYYQIWGSALTPLLSYVIISTIIQSRAINDQAYYRTRHTTFLAIIIFMIVGIAFVLPVISADNIRQMFGGIVALIMIAVFLFAFMDSMVQESKERAEKTAFGMQNKLYSNELDLVKEYQHEIKTIRHNMDNHIQTLNDLLNKKDYENAKSYAKGLAKIVDVDFTPIATGVPELDSILNLKIYQASQIGIKVNSTVRVEEKCKISPQAYISIIGNLMDNAIEATFRCEEADKKHLSISLGIVKGTFFIEITNPYCIELDIVDGEYISSKPVTADHGFGLAHVRAIVKKYGGTLEINDQFNNKNTFNVKVLLFNR